MISVSLELRLPLRLSTPAPTLPPGVIWAQALHDYESPERWDAGSGRFVPDPPRAQYYRSDLGYPVPRSLANPKDRLNDAKGFPEMVPGDPRIGVKLDKNLQWFWFKLLVWSKTGIDLVEQMEGGSLVTFEERYKALVKSGKISASMNDYLLNAWRGLTKFNTAFTNQRGTDNCRDYIRGVNMGTSSLPVLWENTTGGALLRLESDRVYRQGYRLLALKVSDFHIWKNWTPASHPGYFTDATNSTPYHLSTGLPSLIGPWRADRFHYLGGSPVWVPIIAAAGYFHIRTNRLRFMRQGEPFPPRASNT